MKEELRLLQDEVTVLKDELENLTKTVNDMYQMINNKSESIRETQPQGKELKIKFSGNLGDLIGWKKVMSKQLEEQGYSPEEVDGLLTRIQNQMANFASDNPEEDEKVADFRTGVTEAQRVLMESTESQFGVLVNTLEIKGPGNYSLWGVLDNQQKFLNVDPLGIAQVFSVFSNEQRLLMLKALFEHEELTAAQLQEKTGIAPGGQFYHHLKEIASIGLLAKSKRGSYALGSTARSIIATLFAVGNNIKSTTETDIALMINMMEGVSRVNPTEVDAEDR